MYYKLGSNPGQATKEKTQQKLGLFYWKFSPSIKRSEFKPANNKCELARNLE